MKHALHVEPYFHAYVAERPFFMGIIRSIEAALFEPYLPYKQPVLDLGCGDGFFARVAFKKPMELSSKKTYVIDVGLDIAESRIKEAEKEQVYKDIVTYDGHRIPFEDATFHTVISNCVLEHIPNLDEVIGEVYRILKPKGIFITSVMANRWEDYLFGKYLFGDWYVRSMRKRQVHFNLLSHTMWRQHFRQSGFTIKSVEGYIGSDVAKILDIAHYLSLPSLLSYRLTKTWNTLPQFSFLLPKQYLFPKLKKPVKVEDASALFFVLQKP